MNKIFSVVPFAVVFCFVFVCQQQRDQAVKKLMPEADSASDSEAIRKLSNEYGTVVTAGNADRFLNLFTEDAILMPPNSQMLVGKDKIRPWVRAVMENIQGTGFEEITTPNEIRIFGDWAFDSGVTTFKSGGKPTDSTNKYIRIWQKTPDGSWKLARVIWNANNPPSSNSAR